MADEWDSESTLTWDSESDLNWAETEEQPMALKYTTRGGVIIDTGVSVKATTRGGSFEQVVTATGTTITGTVGTLTITGVNATIETSATTEITGGVGTLSIAGVNGNILQGTHISGGVGTLTIAGVNGNILQGTHISGGVGTLTIAGVNGNILQGTHISGGVGAITIAGVDATIVTSIVTGVISDEFASPTGDIDGRTPVPLNNGETWSSPSGILQINGSGKLEITSSSYRAAVIDVHSTDQYIRSTINANGDTTALISLLARSSAALGGFPADFYEARFDIATDNVKLYKRTGGGSFVLITQQSYTLDESTNYDVLFRVKGASQKIYIDDALILSATDGDITDDTGAGAGFGSNASNTATHDNFYVSLPGLQIVSSPAALEIAGVNGSIEISGVTEISGGVGTLEVAGVDATVENTAFTGDILDSFASPTGDIDGRTPVPTSNGATWFSGTGNITINGSGRLEHADSGGGSAHIQSGSVDRSVSAIVNLPTSTPAAGIWLCGSGPAAGDSTAPSNCYYLSYRQNSTTSGILSLDRVVGGGFVELDSDETVPNTAYNTDVELELIKNGSNIQGWANGVKYFDETDSTVPDGTLVGIRAYNPSHTVIYDDFGAKAPRQIIVGSPATLEIAGVNGAVLQGTHITGQVGTLEIAGVDGAILQGTHISGQVGTLAIAGVDGEVTNASPATEITGGVGTLEIAGVDATILSYGEIEDQFAGGAGDLNGRTPSPTSNGSDWTADTDFDLSGSGDVDVVGTGNAFIRIGTAEGSVSIDLNANGANSNSSLWIRVPESATSDLANVPDDGYYVETLFGSNTLNLRKSVSGSLSTIGTYNPSPSLDNSTTYNIALSASGSTLTVYLDGEEVISETDASHTTGQYAAIRQYTYISPGITFDNFNSPADIGTIISGSVGTLAIAGVDGAVLQGTHISGQVGALSVAGVDAVVLSATEIIGIVGTIRINGVNAGIQAATVWTNDPGTDVIWTNSDSGVDIWTKVV